MAQSVSGSALAVRVVLTVWSCRMSGGMSGGNMLSLCFAALLLLIATTGLPSGQGARLLHCIG